MSNLNIPRLSPILYAILLFPRSTLTYTKQDIEDAASSTSLNILMDPAKKDCYYIPTYEGVVLNIFVNAVRGGDRRVIVTLLDPNQSVLLYNMSDQASYSTDSALNGYYTVCIQNVEYMSPKVVYFSAETYLNATPVEFEMRTEESVQGITFQDLVIQLKKISIYLSRAHMIMNQGKSTWARSVSFTIEINGNIYFWSLLQCAVIFVTGVVNVYLIRQLFALPNRVRS